MGHITIFKFKQGMQITKKSDLTNMFRLHHSERHLCDQYHPVHIPVHIAVTTCVNSKQAAYSSYRPYSTHWSRKLRIKIEIVENNHENGLWRWKNSITNGDTDLKEVQVVVLRRVSRVRQPENNNESANSWSQTILLLKQQIHEQPSLCRANACACSVLQSSNRKTYMTDKETATSM